MKTRSLSYTGLLACAILFSPGCGTDRPPMAKVAGRVTVNGEPLKQGTIRFWPEDGRQARSPIDETGHYELTTFEPGDGALVGKHRVSIEATNVIQKEPPPKSLEEEMARAKQEKPIPVDIVRYLVPPQYNRPDTSELTATISEDITDLNFDITTPKSAK